MIVRVDIEPHELAICKMMGNLRSFSCRIVGSDNQNYRDPYEIDEEGFIGEFAFCKHFNVFPDITAKSRKDAIDCKYRGKNFDVKATRLKNGRLIARYNKNVQAYALAIIYETYVLLPGYIMVEDFYKEEHKTGEFGDSYVVGQHKLTQWGENGR